MSGDGVGNPRLARLFRYTVLAQMRRIAQFFREETGQDVVEYTLLLAAVILAVAAAFPIVVANTKLVMQFIAGSLSHRAVLSR